MTVIYPAMTEKVAAQAVISKPNIRGLDVVLVGQDLNNQSLENLGLVVPTRYDLSHNTSMARPMDLPLVSIVTPCLNGRQFLRLCIESVLSQSNRDWEWLVIDDGSTDGSVAILEHLAADDSRVRLLRTSGFEGAAIARNLGMKVARGRYVAFLDCDDLWLPEKLKIQLTRMAAENISFSWSSYLCIDEAGKHLRTQVSSARCTYRDLLTKRQVIGCLTAIYDREHYGCQQMPLIRMGQDYGLFLQLLRIAETRNLCTRGLIEPLAKYRIHAGATTRNKWLKAWYQWRLYRDIEHLSFIDSLYCFASYVFHGARDRISR